MEISYKKELEDSNSNKNYLCKPSKILKFRRILKLNNNTKMNGKKKKVKNLFAFSQAFLKIKRKKTIKLALKKYKEN